VGWAGGGKRPARPATRIKARRVDLITLDPFVKNHTIEANNSRITDEVAQLRTDLAAKHDVAVDATTTHRTGSPTRQCPSWAGAGHR